MHFVSVAWGLIGEEFFTEIAEDPSARASNLNMLTSQIFGSSISRFRRIEESSFTSVELPSDFSSAEEAYRQMNPDQAENDRQEIVYALDYLSKVDLESLE